MRTKKLRVKQKRRSGGKKVGSLKEVDINNIVNCVNKKHGCDLIGKQFTCYKRVKYQRNKSAADKITFTNTHNKTKRIKPVLRVGNTWYDCSHFTPLRK